ncbi:glycoside hydrolase family 3 protein [Marvinbryantia sp.]|uniref:glycoside hydrolase family 3 protein n=1 Tax=Marvinbryantia sp. TaxID=2496532 RepID=UPI003A8CAF17
MLDLAKRPFYLNAEQIHWVKDTLAHLTTEQKAGQLFCVMGGDYEKDELKELVKKSRVGGILFRPAPAEEICENYRLLDEVAPVPLLKAANLEEGGAGATTDGTLFGWPMMVGAANDDGMVEKFGKVCAAEGQSVGVNWTFSPVCDIDMNYRNPITNVRTYGSDKDKVKKNTQIYVEAVQKCGVAACAKHFPGDGVDYRDHHLHPTYNSLSAEEWYGSYGAVYQNLIEHDLLSIMVGHIVQPAVQMEINPKLSFADCLPASQSRELLTGVLREKFGFNGVITTDATIMGGYCMAMERRKAIPASVMAGCDMIVFNTNLYEDYSYILEGLKTGLLTEERLDDAVTRILALKAKVCGAGKDRTYTGLSIDGNGACIGNAQEHSAGAQDMSLAQAAGWHRECADKSVTLVKSLAPRVLPVTKEKYPQIRLITLGKDEIPGGSMAETAIELLRQRGFAVEHYQPFADDLHGCADLPKNRLTLYLANYEQASNQTTVRINWCPKHALDSPRFLNEEDCIFVSLANPYLLQDVPRVKTYINAYTATKTTIETVIEKLTGESEFKGISPADAFCGLPDTRI